MPGESSVFHPDKVFQYGNLGGLQLAICIPAQAEPNLTETLESLNQCEPSVQIAVFICLNSAAGAAEDVIAANISSFMSVQRFCDEEKPEFAVWCGLYASLPPKKAGVGLARKLAMDASCLFLDEKGIIACLDADCTVSTNYITEIMKFFNTNQRKVAASVYFEHRIPNETTLQNAIASYELHLRYLKNALKNCGYPWYYHTVGSSMVVRRSTYLSSGGMNTRQAGEDFYFLHKLMPLGYGEINQAAVYPEARFSNRVPFGTGRSMLKFKEDGLLLTYDLRCFEALKKLFDHVSEWDGTESFPWREGLDPMFSNHLAENGFEKAMMLAKQHTSGVNSARKRLLQWFSGFCIIRMLHFLRTIYPDTDILTMAGKLAMLYKYDVKNETLLEFYRRLDRN